ncbi:MAG: hypothetical protein JXR96_10060 [Deltaproteobacteria bacterium]|nr:hypothetical protein [Deltaproteobacteria bacterium]
MAVVWVFDIWVIETTERFGGISVLGTGLLGLWYDEELKPEENPVEDHNNWYKIGVEPGRIGELRAYIQKAASTFGQKCIYFERAGEADFLQQLDSLPE